MKPGETTENCHKGLKLLRVEDNYFGPLYIYTNKYHPELRSFNPPKEVLNQTHYTCKIHNLSYETR